MFCAVRLVFDGNEGTSVQFSCLCSQNRFLWHRGRQVQISSFALPDTFSAKLRAPDPIFMFCAPEPKFGGIEGAVSSFHVLRSKTHCRQYRGHQIQFFRF
jgi:hypothetical protein